VSVRLLPTEAPTEALQCTYDGMNGKPFQLISAQHLNATEAADAAAKIRALPLGSRGITVINCPMDDGKATVVVFGYPHRSDIDIWEYTSGCRFTDNGHIIANWF